jgi:hypothetical protein
MGSSGDKEADQSEAGGEARPSEAHRNGQTGLVSVDAEIDAIARKALESARRAEKAEKLRRKPDPVFGPRTCREDQLPGIMDISLSPRRGSNE